MPVVNHWRPELGYHVVEHPAGPPAGPPPPPPPPPPPGGFWGPPPGAIFGPPPAAPPDQGGVFRIPPQMPPTAPANFRIPEADGRARAFNGGAPVAPPPGWFWNGGWHHGAPAPAPAPAKALYPGLHLAGGKPDGIGYLYTGEPTTIHIITEPQASRILDHPNSVFWDINFTAQKTTSNSTVNDFMAALGGGAGSVLTQVHEHGDGLWRAGTAWKKGSREANDTLKTLGWADAGSNSRSPIWVCFKKG